MVPCALPAAIIPPAASKFMPIWPLAQDSNDQFSAQGRLTLGFPGIPVTQKISTSSGGVP
jgi:hypothetical protein